MELAPSLRNTSLLTSGVTLLTLSKTAVEEHRHWTHQSLGFQHPTIEVLARAAGAHLADTKAWASVHRIHHRMPDVNLVPFVAIADYINWHESQKDISHGIIDIPDVVVGLDPVLDEISTEDAREIGELAREEVVDRYRPESSYSKAEARDIFYADKKYQYESSSIMKRDRKNPITFNPDLPPTLQQIRFLLRDPHSPALHPDGILGVLRENVGLYGYAERNFQDPNFRDTDLQPDNLDDALRDHRAKLRLAYVGAMALAGIAVNKRISNTNFDTLVHATLGAAASGAVVLSLIAGGNITNSLGHGGDLNRLTFREFVDGVVYPQPDGTYTSNYKPLSPVTLDEVGGQDEHHKFPWLVAYTTAKGKRKWAEAPFGSFLDFMVNNELLLKIGENFGDNRRLDMPSEAVKRIIKLRAKHIEASAGSGS